jgi:hypothetical protein
VTGRRRGLKAGVAVAFSPASQVSSISGKAR